MDLALSEAQQALKNKVRQLMDRECNLPRLQELDDSETGFSAPMWQGLAEMGLVGLGIPKRYGGGGGSYTDLSVLYHELGRACAPVPHFSSAVLAAQIIGEAGSEAQKAALLPEIAQGKRILAVAINEADYGWEPQQIQLSATRQGDVYLLKGTKVFVPDAQIAQQLIVVARTGPEAERGITLFLVDRDAEGLGLRNLEGFVAGRLSEVIFEGVKVPASAAIGPIDGGWPVLDLVLARCTPILCAYMVGGSERVFEMTRDRASERIQFGSVIGTFQRVQDHIIEIVNQMDAARWTMLEAVWKLDAGKPDWRTSASLAKAVASEAFHEATYQAHEVTAGAGSRREFGLDFYTRAARTLYWYLGDPKLHREKLADLLKL